MTQRYPSLRHRAGKYFAKMTREPSRPPKRHGPSLRRSEGREVVVRPVLKQEINVEQLARALAVLIIEEQKKGKRDDQDRAA
jgi:hypothetical protein